MGKTERVIGDFSLDGNFFPEEEEEEILLVEDEGSETGPLAFAPHKFDISVSMDLGFPKIAISPQAYGDMLILVEKSVEMNIELGWLGIVEPIPNSVDLLISEIILPEQECGISETKITADGMFKVYEILKKRNGKDLMSKIRFWGHSHIGIATKPSSQDISQIDFFRKSRCEFFLRGIVNDKGRMEFTLFLFALGITIHDVEWRMFSSENPTRRKFWAKEIHDKVDENKFVAYDPAKGYGYGYQPNQPNQWQREQWQQRDNPELWAEK